MSAPTLHDAPVPCTECHGVGKWAYTRCHHIGTGCPCTRHYLPCERCQGTGEEPCEWCMDPTDVSPPEHETRDGERVCEDCWREYLDMLAADRGRPARRGARVIHG